MGIRAAVEADLPVVIAIQAMAGQLFRDFNMGTVADGELPTAEHLLPAVHDGRLMVTVDGNDVLVGFALVEWVDARAHLDQVSVDPTFAGRGFGRQLMGAVEQWGRKRGSHAITLTTFIDVPWNGPYYRRLGWLELPASELGPELAALRRHEAALGLDAWPRTAMIKQL